MPQDHHDLFEIIKDRRGWSDEYLHSINQPTGEQLKDTDLFIEKLHTLSKDPQHHIVVHPDFDMDGVTSGTIAYAGLSELGFNVSLHIPDYTRGHGMLPIDIVEITEQFPTVTAILTTDNGISSFEGVQAAKDQGLKVFITDHHLGADESVNADVIIDPSRKDDPYPNKGICGAQVIYKLLIAYTEKYRPHQSYDISLLKVFAGMGTVSDVMPILFENRQMVMDSASIARLLYSPPVYLSNQVNEKGKRPVKDVYETVQSAPLLLMLSTNEHSEPFINALEGVAVMMHEFAVHNKMYRGRYSIDIGFYGFYAAPVFNAVRRVESDIKDAFDVFNSNRQAEAFNQLLADNDRRKELTPILTEEIEKAQQEYEPYIYFASEKTPAGMLGLIANQIMHRTGEPTCVFKKHDDGSVGGSARSPIWYNLNSHVNQAGFTAIGHEHACGVYVNDESEVSVLYNFFKESVQDAKGSLGDIDLEAPDLRLGPSREADAPIVDLEEMAYLVQRIQTLEPFGHDFPAPVIDIEVDLAEVDFRMMGSDMQHLKIITPLGIVALWWNKADEIKSLKERATSANHNIVLRGSLALNEFNDVVSVQFMIDSIR